MLDSHAHILSRDTARFPPADGSGETAAWLQRNGFEAADLLAAMDGAGVRHALLVQRGQFYRGDNSYVCAAAADHPDRFHAICGIDGRSPQAGEMAREWLDRGCVGLRLMGRPDSADLDWLAGENALPVWRHCAERGVPLCVHLFRPARAPGIARIGALQQRFGLCAIVVDHLAASVDPASEGSGIDDDLRLLAEVEAVALKFTTIPLGTLARRGIDAAPIIEDYVALMGEDRLIWGSDITQSSGTYGEMVAFARAATQKLAPGTAAKLLGGNTSRIYRLDRSVGG